MTAAAVRKFLPPPNWRIVNTKKYDADGEALVQLPDDEEGGCRTKNFEITPHDPARSGGYMYHVSADVRSVLPLRMAPDVGFKTGESGTTINRVLP